MEGGRQRANSIHSASGSAPKQNRQLFVSHLQKHSSAEDTPSTLDIHPAFIRLGLMYGEHKILGSTARATALISCLKQFVNDYVTPEDKELARDLNVRLTHQIDYINTCRPKSISMGAVLQYLKQCLSLIKPGMSEAESKKLLVDRLDIFLERRILVAHEAMVGHACEKFGFVEEERDSTDVILTFARSHVVERMLLKVRPQKVIIVDSEPYFEGRMLLKKLTKEGIACAYAPISAVSHMMRGVTKVLLGAHAMLHNGGMLSRCGAATVAMTARSYGVPVLVACETFKFSEHAPLDALAINELGDADYELPAGSGIDVLNLVYDVTPVDFIDLIFTEVGCIPPTSVPVVLREIRKDQLAL
eukprot:ANDGO_03210.mRNA.1 Translation initiation factor eIF-2B subunit delta